MQWNCHVYDPRTQTTSTKRLEIPSTSSMADSAYAVAYASKKLHKHMRYILCVPTPRGQQTKHARTR